MPEPLLAILKLCALALLYLFFIRVLRAVWAEVTPARAAPSTARATRASRPAKAARRSRRGDGDALVVLEPAEQKGRRHLLTADELTVGRAAGCTLTLDDNYVSQLHARVFRRDDRLHVEDLGSTNGTYVNGRKTNGAVPLKRGDRVKIGATLFEVQA